MGIVDQFQQLILDACRTIAAPVLSIPIQWMRWTGLVPLVFWLIGKRLSLIVKPERPYLSPVLRIFGSTIKWLGLIIITLVLTGFVVLLALLFLHQILFGVSATDAIKQAWMIVFQPGGEHILRWLEGCLLGLIISLPISMYYIPRWERGIASRM